MKQGYNSRLDESLGSRNGKKTQSLKDRRDESKGAEEGDGNRAYSAVSTMGKPKKKRTVVKYTAKDGTKVKSVERRSGKRVETAKNKKTGVRSRQVTGKDGNIKKTVTRTKGGVEKEIERGNKRIDVRKYKDEGVKTRTVTNMKKAAKNAAKSLSESAIKGAISGSAFRNLPSSMVKEAMKPENNVLPANRMDALQQKANQPMINKLNNMSLKQRRENK